MSDFSGKVNQLNQGYDYISSTNWGETESLVPYCHGTRTNYHYVSRDMLLLTLKDRLSKISGFKLPDLSSRELYRAAGDGCSEFSDTHLSQQLTKYLIEHSRIVIPCLAPIHHNCNQRDYNNSILLPRDFREIMQGKCRNFIFIDELVNYLDEGEYDDLGIHTLYEQTARRLQLMTY